MASGDTINAAFPYFDEDFRRDTFHLSDREKLIYKSALCYVWKHGFIPADPQAFALVTYANGTRKWRECVANVQRMMRTCADQPDRLTHPRVEEDRANYLAQRAKTRQRKRALDSRKSEVTRYDRVPSSFTSSFLKSPSSNNENLTERGEFGRESEGNLCVESAGTEAPSAPGAHAPSPAHAGPPPSKANGHAREGPSDLATLPVELRYALENYNAIAEYHGLPQAKRLTARRRRQLEARLREHGLNGWNAALEHIEQAPFLCGQNDRGWRADLDFLLQPSSLLKLMEGAYDGRQPDGG